MKLMSKTGLLGTLSLAFLLIAGNADATYRYGGYYGGPGAYGGTVRCESRNGRTAFCRVDARAGVRLLEQVSRSACIRGRTWGVDQDYIWVSRGCRARFEVGAPRYGYESGGYDYYPPNDGYAADPYYDNRSYYSYDNRGNVDNRSYYGSAQVLRCESHEGRFNFCDTRGGIARAQIRRQLSDASCRLNQTWGVRDGGVWVDRGCRAEFIVY